MIGTFKKIDNLFVFLIYFNCALFVVLLLAEKTKDFCSFIEYVQHIYILKFIDFYYGIGLENILSNFEFFFGKFLKINTFSHYETTFSNEELPAKLRVLKDFDVSLINNLGEIIVVLLIACFFLIALTFLRFTFKFEENSIISYFHNKIKFPFFMRYFELTALPIFFFCYLEIFTNKFKNNNNYLEGMFGVLMLIYSIFMLVNGFMIINYDENLSIHNPKEYIKKYSVLLEKLNLSRTSSKNYFVVKGLFNIVLAFIMTQFMGNFRIQLMGILALLIIKLLYIVICKPFQSNSNNCAEISIYIILFMIHFLLLYISYDLSHFAILAIFLYSFIIIGYVFSSLQMYFGLIQAFKIIKMFIIKLIKGEYTLGLRARSNKHLFIEFEEKRSQNTKENINLEQKQYDAFFLNPSPEISEHSHEIAKINLGNYVQTEIKENEKYENHDKKQNIVKLISKSLTTRNPKIEGDEQEKTNLADLSFTLRQKKIQEQIGLKKIFEKKGKTERQFKEVMKI